jgi:nucleoside-diphosphate-sugar epimerase
MTMKNKLSVYGSTGFIGSSFCKMFDCDSVERNTRTPITDEVLYLISTTHNYNVLEDSFIDIDTNLSTLLETLDACRKNGINTFNFISSWFVYGDTELPATETSNCNPKGFYSITKRCAEQLLISYCETFKIDYRILRLCNVYGGTDKSATKKKNALQYLIDEMKINNKISLYDAGNFYRNYMHLSDVCRAINLVCKKGDKNQIYNIGSINNYLFSDIIELAIKELDYNLDIMTMEIPDFHKIVQVKDILIDTKKLQMLGFSEKVSIENGIKELCKTS